MLEYIQSHGGLFLIDRQELQTRYYTQSRSMQQIASDLGCSVHAVTYWMDKYSLKRRSISDAIYVMANPNGDPFKAKPIKTNADATLYGLGIGLYWGEGNKANRHSVRLGNTDPALIVTFMDFLIKLFGVKREKLRFGLQIFSDINPDEALAYWIERLGVSSAQFGKTIVTPARSVGTYRNKCQYGVVTVLFHNKKLRDILVESLPR